MICTLFPTFCSLSDITSFFRACMKRFSGFALNWYGLPKALKTFKQVRLSRVCFESEYLPSSASGYDTLSPGMLISPHRCSNLNHRLLCRCARGQKTSLRLTEKWSKRPPEVRTEGNMSECMRTVCLLNQPKAAGLS